jgi:hypothetical protein
MYNLIRKGEMTVRPLTGLLLASIPLLLGGCAIPVGVAIASYAADGVLLLTTDKSSTDHLLSMSSGQDCAMWRVIKGRQICAERAPGENPYDVDYDAPYREVDEGGMVSVYTASRQGGRLLTDEEAKAALSRQPMVAGNPPPGDGPAAATVDRPAPPPAPAVQTARATLPDPVAPRPARTAKRTRAVKPMALASRARPTYSIAGKRKPTLVAARRPARPAPPASVPESVGEPTPTPEPAPIEIAAVPPEAWR